jgi:hypothetical protein
MTIIEFYKKLSSILTDARENFISHKQAKKKLNELLEKSKEFELQINVSEDILDPINLMRLDDERSFREGDEDDEDDEYNYSDFSF